MKRASIIACLVTAATSTSLAQSPTPLPKDAIIRIQFPQSQLTDVIKFYQHITRRKTWIDAELRFDRPISVASDKDFRRDDAVAFIRENLRKEGIEIREVGDSEAYVTRVAQ